MLLTLCGCGAARPDDPLTSWSGVAQAAPITLAQVNTTAVSEDAPPTSTV